MKIELKKLKIAKHLSEETLAYTADVYIDGKLAFHAKNDGQGGADVYYRVGDVTVAEVDAWAKENVPPYVGELGTLEADMEMAIGNLIERMDAEKQLNRWLKSKVVLIDDQDTTYTVACQPTQQNIDAVAAKNPGLVIVNNCSPELRERVLTAMTA